MDSLPGLSIPCMSDLQVHPQLLWASNMHAFTTSAAHSYTEGDLQAHEGHEDQALMCPALEPPLQTLLHKDKKYSSGASIIMMCNEYAIKSITAHQEVIQHSRSNCNVAATGDIPCGSPLLINSASTCTALA